MVPLTVTVVRMGAGWSCGSTGEDLLGSGVTCARAGQRGRKGSKKRQVSFIDCYSSMNSGDDPLSSVQHGNKTDLPNVF
jgi:hypothetical protein